MRALIDRITGVLREHELGYSKPRGFHCVSITCDWYGHDLDFPEHVAERIAEALQLELEELEAVKALLSATQEQLSRTVADFCAVRDALPRKQVEQILAAAEVKS